MELCEAIRLGHFLIGHSKNVVFAGSVDDQPVCCSLVKHPLEREFRETAFQLRVTAAHIGMDSGKPNLLYVLRVLGINLPEILTKSRATLIDRNGMATYLDVGIRSEERRVGKRGRFRG